MVKKEEIADKKKEDDPKKKEEETETELSPEDLKLKEDLDLCIERMVDENPEIVKAAIETVRKEIRESTSSMTSVPKPLKLLRPRFEDLIEIFNKYPDSENKQHLSDVISILAMTGCSKTGVPRESLKYKLTGSREALETWGQEYVRQLSGEIGEEFGERKEKGLEVDDLLALVDDVAPFHIKFNAEPDACDLLLEVECLPNIIDLSDETNYPRICLYLTQCATYHPEPEYSQILNVVLSIFRKLNQYSDALKIAIKLNNQELIEEVFNSCSDKTIKYQLGFMLARQNITIEDDQDEDLNNVVWNTKLNEYFLELGRDLNIMEPKEPEDIYKSHLNDIPTNSSATIDSARGNLASTFVNALVNAGFGSDSLMIEDGNKWIYKNKEHGKMSASASLGMILLWDVDGGLPQIDPCLYSTDSDIKAGALLGVGIVNASIKNDCDPALAILSEYIEDTNGQIRSGAILGLAIAYAGSRNEDLCEMLTPILSNSTGVTVEILGVTALALGMIFVGSCDPKITQLIIDVFLDKNEETAKSSHSRYLSLGLGLLYLGQQDKCEVTLQTLALIAGNLGRYTQLTLETCAYAGTGNVLKIQKMLHECSEQIEKEEDTLHQAVAVLGISLISMGEELGTEMAMRTFEHLLQYGEITIKRTVPLAIGLLNISNPTPAAMDTLSKLTHDADPQVAQSAIFALGIVGAGTNNSRIVGLLRALSVYYYKEPNHLFLVRIAQGFLHMGKGTLSLNPMHTDRYLLNNVAVASVLGVFHSCFDIKNIILGQYHYFLYLVANAMHPRLLMTFDEELNPIEVSVRVGQALDTVGQAGKPKTITGFATHKTPVLLSHGDRAELANDDEYLTFTNCLEGFCILRKLEDN